MVHAGQELTGSGNYLRFIRTAAETDGELLEMESTYREGAGLPAAHFHPAQDESFEVLEGTVTTIIDGVETSHAAGETFQVPAGAVHQMVGEAGSPPQLAGPPCAQDGRVLRRPLHGQRGSAAWRGVRPRVIPRRAHGRGPVPLTLRDRRSGAGR